MAQQLGDGIEGYAMVDQLGSEGVAQAMWRGWDFNGHSPLLKTDALLARGERLILLNPEVINYLKATQAPVGLIFNFGRRRLEYRRVFPGPNAGAPIQRLGRDNVKKANLPDPT